MDLELLGNSIFYIAKNIQEVIELCLRNYPLNYSQIQILLMIKQLSAKTCVNQETLALHLHLDKSNISRNLSYLKQNGYVVTQPAKRDSRRREITLTPKGNFELQYIIKVMRDISVEMTQNISPEKGDITITTLTDIMKNLEHMKDELI
ncbi:MAG: MarR family transcriptional regulator, transcriptional regulator for hemolysin [Clostridiales bacterium]|nr:MarR family transcriptional regulator, transcriptional regulator for hemolysin [Clostridiales bacterium]